MSSYFNGKNCSPISCKNNSTDVELSQKNFENNNIEYTPENLNVNSPNSNNQNNIQSIVNNENTENIQINRPQTLNSTNKIHKPSPLLITNNLNMNFKLNMSNILPLFLNPQLEEHIKEEKSKKKFTCNCKKTKCLKLYCECFANNEYCIDCKCCECSNVIGNEFEIKKNYNEVKDKNPVALKLNLISKNNENSIGCNCTKSNCLKKYCECFKIKKFCGENCRCRDCDNVVKNNNNNKEINNTEN